MKMSKFLVSILLAASVMTAFIGPLEAGNEDNMGNAISKVDEMIGAIAKGVAITYVNIVNFEAKRNRVLQAIARADEKSFDKYYAHEYYRVVNKVPYEILPYIGIPPTMTKNEAMSFAASFDRERAKQIINSVPNVVAGACLRRLVNNKFHGNPTEAEVKEAANELAQDALNKINR